MTVDRLTASQGLISEDRCRSRSRSDRRSRDENFQSRSPANELRIYFLAASVISSLRPLVACGGALQAVFLLGDGGLWRTQAEMAASGCSPVTSTHQLRNDLGRSWQAPTGAVLNLSREFAVRRLLFR